MIRTSFRSVWAIVISVLTILTCDGRAYAGNGGIASMGAEEALFLEFPMVFAASKREQSILEAPATTIVVSKKEIRHRGYRNLIDLLADLPGMETIPFYYERGTQIPVRGIYGNNKIVLLINGMRVNLPGGGELMFHNDQSIRYAERVEVVFGPGSALYGADAVSLIINIVTQKAADKEGGDVNVSYGTKDTFEGSASAAYKIGENMSFSSYAQYYSSEETDYPKDYARWWQPFQQTWVNTGSSPLGPYHRYNQGLNLFTELTLNKDTRLQHWYRWSARSAANGENAVNSYFEGGDWVDSTNVVRLQNTTDIFDSLSLKTALTFNFYEIDPKSRYVFRNSATTQHYTNFKYGRSSSIENENILDWKTMDGKLDLAWGVAASVSEDIPKASFVPSGFFDSQNLVTQVAGRHVTYFDSAADALAGTNGTNLGLVTEIQWKRYSTYLDGSFKASEKISTSLGVRYEKDSRFDNSVVTPRGSAAYMHSPHMTLKYIYGEAYVLPNTAGQFQVLNLNTVLIAPNFDLKPEKSKSHEINLTYAKERVTGIGAFYYNTQNNLLDFDSRSATPNNTIKDIWMNVGGVATQKKLIQSINQGKSSMYGFDTYLKYDFTRDGNVWLGYSMILDAEFNNNGVKTGLPSISENHLRLGGTYYVIDKKLFFSPRFTWRSDPNHSNGTRAASYPDQQNIATPSLYLNTDKTLLKNIYQFDLYGGYHLSRHIELFTRLSNLTNHKYYTRALSEDMTIPAETFRVELGTIYKFGPE